MTDLETRFTALSLAELQRFVADGQEENLHLEFKTLSGPDFGIVEDRRNLARALSGFANSDGGIIIWGVKADKSGDSPDCAKALQPISKVALLLSRLNELTSDALSPVHSTVQHRIVHINDDGSGLAATLVPSSDSGPHMAKLRVDQYFKRAGDSFVKMEHFDIADMFGRRPHPVLDFRVLVQGDGGVRSAGVESLCFKVIGVIENTGRGSAVAPYLAVSVHQPYAVSEFGVDGNGSFGLPALVRNGAVRRFGASATVMLHPGTAIEVFGIRGKFEIENPDLMDLVVDYEFGASDLPLEIGTLELTAEDIVHALRSLPSPF